MLKSDRKTNRKKEAQFATGSMMRWYNEKKRTSTRKTDKNTWIGQTYSMWNRQWWSEKVSL